MKRRTLLSTPFKSADLVDRKLVLAFIDLLEGFLKLLGYGFVYGDIFDLGHFLSLAAVSEIPDLNLDRRHMLHGLCLSGTLSADLCYVDP